MKQPRVVGKARREHECGDGKRKKALTSREAAICRERGFKVYQCTVCGQHHSATPFRGGS